MFFSSQKACLRTHRLGNWVDKHGHNRTCAGKEPDTNSRSVDADCDLIFGSSRHLDDFFDGSGDQQRDEK